jgi:hypothetical protein
VSFLGGVEEEKEVAAAATIRLPSVAVHGSEDEISLIRLIKIFATILLLRRVDLIHWGFLDAF